MERFRILIITLFCIIASSSWSQIVTIDKEEKIDKDSLIRAFDSQPSFGLYKDNYFIAGIPIGDKPTGQNSNVKFQISISQRLTKSTLPWNTYLFLFYSQKCWWNVFEESMPMTEFNFNPGIGIAKPLFVKDRFIGKLTLMVEHESNGREDIHSRSWERISAAANIMISPGFIVHGKFWIPIVDGQHNKDILDYCGIYQVGTSIMSQNKRFGLSVILTKRTSDWFSYNTVVEMNYKIFKGGNQYMFAQYYNGYGEGLYNYNKFTSMLRIGLVIKPTLFSDY